MIYQSRKRNYQSRREKLQRDQRLFGRLLLFAGIILLIYLFITRDYWWWYLRTYFY